MIRVLITGPTGFIGRHCLARLMREECEIHAVSRTMRQAPDDRVRWHVSDLRDPAAARQLVAAVQPTHVLHIAWEAKPPLHMASSDNLLWLQAGIALASAFGEAKGQRFVGVGTAAEYEAGHERCIEDSTPIRPASVYGKAKAACWQGVEAAAECYGFSAAWGRLFITYDRDDPSPRLIPAVIRALDQKKPVETTDGLQLRDFIYAPDAADLLVRLVFSRENGAFNVASGEATTIRSVIESIADRRGGRDLLRLGSIQSRAGDPRALVADMTKVSTKLGWSAPTPIELGLARILA